MVELRKRKTPPPAPVRPAKKKAAPKAEKKSTVAKAKAAVVEQVEAVKEAVTGKKTNGEAAKDAPATLPAGTPKVGESITLSGFGGEVETHDGTKTTLEKLVGDSKGGVVLFTYPKASTPGCECPSARLKDESY